MLLRSSRLASSQPFHPLWPCQPRIHAMGSIAVCGLTRIVVARLHSSRVQSCAGIGGVPLRTRDCDDCVEQYTAHVHSTTRIGHCSERQSSFHADGRCQVPAHQPSSGDCLSLSLTRPPQAAAVQQSDKDGALTEGTQLRRRHASRASNRSAQSATSSRVQHEVCIDGASAPPSQLQQQSVSQQQQQLPL